MNTQILSVDALHPQPDVIAQAAEVLRRGGLVAFPTETVYGLGASAFDAEAVGRIFLAKGRPATNPIIVHIGQTEQVHDLVAYWPELAAHLAARFWPGPLTLVLPRSAAVPDIVTAGGPTVAIRQPAHPVALALLRACSMPIAAPSANPSGELSPTQARHVLRGLDGRIDMLLDSGPTPGGLESTVLDVTMSPPHLLRPGLVTPAEIESVVGLIQTDAPPASQQALRSPGLLHRHYAPRTPLELATNRGHERVRQLLANGLRIGWLALTDTEDVPGVQRVLMPMSAVDYAADLYGTLHLLDEMSLDRLVVELPPDEPEWLAIRDRLHRAAHT